ncbi:MAG: hypothetical protein NVS2B2_36230 [Ktedonobacteraceae bacterium]
MKKRSFQQFRLEEITNIRLEDTAREVGGPLEMPPTKVTLLDIGSILLILARILELISF